MTPEQIEQIAQIIGIFAMIFMFLSFQQKKKSGIIFCQLVGAVLFAINFFLLDAPAGCVMNVVAIVRAIVFLFPDRLRTRHPAWLVGFIAVYLLSYASVFTLFGKELTPYNLAVEALPVAGLILTTVAFRAKSTRTIRRLGLINSPLWLTYNILCFSVGAIASEILSLASILIAIVRYDIRGGAEAADTADTGEGAQPPSAVEMTKQKETP